MAHEIPGEQDHSIKARKNELFEQQTNSGPRRPFAEYLEQAPPVPLTQAQKAALWGIGALVALIFLIAMLTMPSHHHHMPGANRSPGNAASSK